MARMLGSTLKLVGRCHPQCGNQEYPIDRAYEERQWRREWDYEQSSTDLEYDLMMADGW